MGLRKLLGQAATWRIPEQRVGAIRLFNLASSAAALILVLPTGAGKSIFFFLPAVVEVSGTTVVVVPFVALLNDLAERASAARLDFLLWKREFGEDREGTKQRDARLVLISADLAVSARFLGYLESLRSRGQLRRVFIDETHTILVDQTYRSRLGQLKQLYRFLVPLIFLTATLPTGLEKTFRKEVGAEDAEIIRARTDKLNISYRVRQLSRTGPTLETAVTQEVVQATGRLQSGEKGIVYCRSKAKAECVAQQLGCRFFHSGLDDSDKESALQGWISAKGGTRWIVATTGLGTGIDIQGVRIIVHSEAPYGLVDFLQQTGRAGRGAGDIAESITVLSPARLSLAAGATDIEVLNQEGLAGFITTKDCRRLRLGEFFDGAGRSCSDLSAVLCDNCASKQEGVTAEKESRIATLTKERALLERKMQRFFQETEGRCAACVTLYHYQRRNERYAHHASHGKGKCKALNFQHYLQWKGKLRFREGSCCWLCGLPERFCEKEGGTGRCLHLDKALVVALLFWEREGLREGISSEFSVEFSSQDDYSRWLQGERMIEGERATNAIGVFELFIRVVFE